MSVTYPKSGLQTNVAFQQNGKPGVYPVQSWNDEIGTFQFASVLPDGYTLAPGAAVVVPVGGDGVRLPEAGDAIAVGQPAAAKAAMGSLIFSALPAADATVTIGAKTYKFVSALTAANDVLLGTTVAATIENLVAAINGGAGIGEKYGAGTEASTEVAALASENNTIAIKALAAGVAGNALALTTTSDAITPSGATLAGGAAAGDATAPNAVFAGVVAFSYWITVQDAGYAKAELDVNVPVKQKGYINVLMSSIENAAFGKEVALDMDQLGKFKVAGANDIVVGKINQVYPAYGTCEIELKEFI